MHSEVRQNEGTFILNLLQLCSLDQTLVVMVHFKCVCIVPFKANEAEQIHVFVVCQNNKFVFVSCLFVCLPRQSQASV